MKNSTFSKENQTEINNIMDAIKILTREKDEKENQLNEFKQKLYELLCEIPRGKAARGQHGCVQKHHEL